MNVLYVSLAAVGGLLLLLGLLVGSLLNEAGGALMASEV